MPENWNIDDRRWREERYLDHIYRMHLNDLNYLHLESLERVRFAQDQPAQFAAFAGRYADLGIRHLRLAKLRGQQLRLSLAGEGVRVPGTRFVLRATRPWYAFFEERLGDFPALPSDWMEGARLVRCPGGGVEWLGRRHPMTAYEGFDFSDFREMPSGWKCDHPTARETDDALHREINQVLAEIAEYSEHILPEMAELNPGMFPRKRRVTRLGQPRWDMPPLTDWQLAAARLAGALSTETATLPRIYNVDELGDFLWQEPGTPYVVENGRIRWLNLAWRRDWWRTDSIPEKHRPANPQDKEQRFTAIKAWLLDPETRSDEVWNAVFMELNAVAEIEPDVARKVLDIREWRERIRSDTRLTEAERQDELSKTYGYFNYVLNNAVLHVLHTLADSHFMEIRKFLGLPSFRSGYAGHLPEYLLDTLFTKVQVLTDLRLCVGRLVGPARQAS